jgi:hypothetical protein
MLPKERRMKGSFANVDKYMRDLCITNGRSLSMLIDPDLAPLGATLFSFVRRVEIAIVCRRHGSLAMTSLRPDLVEGSSEKRQPILEYSCVNRR